MIATAHIAIVVRKAHRADAVPAPDRPQPLFAMSPPGPQSRSWRKREDGTAPAEQSPVSADCNMAPQPSAAEKNACRRPCNRALGEACRLHIPPRPRPRGYLTPLTRRRPTPASLRDDLNPPPSLSVRLANISTEKDGLFTPGMQHMQVRAGGPPWPARCCRRLTCSPTSKFDPGLVAARQTRASYSPRPSLHPALPSLEAWGPHAETPVFPVPRAQQTSLCRLAPHSALRIGLDASLEPGNPVYARLGARRPLSRPVAQNVARHTQNAAAGPRLSTTPTLLHTRIPWRTRHPVRRPTGSRASHS